jgi:hypothetical protein
MHLIGSASPIFPSTVSGRQRKQASWTQVCSFNLLDLSADSSDLLHDFALLVAAGLTLDNTILLRDTQIKFVFPTTTKHI